MTESNASRVAEICCRLEGIPLALELAAARVRILGVVQLAGRLDESLPLLTSGSGTASARHQTLRATMDWSYDLLSETERTLFARSAVFAGGWTLEAARGGAARPPMLKPARPCWTCWRSWWTARW